MAEQTAKSVKSTENVDFDIKITETADGALSVGYVTSISGSDPIIKVHPRPAHLVGVLVCAAFFVIMENFDTLKAELTKKKK